MLGPALHPDMVFCPRAGCSWFASVRLCARPAVNLGGCSYNQDCPGLCVAKWGETGLNKAPCLVPLWLWILRNGEGVKAPKTGAFLFPCDLELYRHGCKIYFLWPCSFEKTLNLFETRQKQKLLHSVTEIKKKCLRALKLLCGEIRLSQKD